MASSIARCSVKRTHITHILWGQAAQELYFNTLVVTVLQVLLHESHYTHSRAESIHWYHSHTHTYIHTLSSSFQCLVISWRLAIIQWSHRALTWFWIHKMFFFDGSLRSKGWKYEKSISLSVLINSHCVFVMCVEFVVLCIVLVSNILCI